MANMIGAFFSAGREAADIFDTLQISKISGYGRHLNAHNVIYIDFSSYINDHFC